MTSWRGLAGLALAGMLAACATQPQGPAAPRRQPVAHGRHHPSGHAAPRPAPSAVTTDDWTDLPGWNGEDHLAALAAVSAACAASKDVALIPVCRRLRAAAPADEAAARAFLEHNFRYALLAGDGLLTAYFSPQYEAREAPVDDFTAPVRPKPAVAVAVSAPDVAPDPIADVLDPSTPIQPPPVLAPPIMPDRGEIEAQPAPDALAWMRPEDLFFLQIQGSGVLVFPDGVRLKAAFTASNGQPFVGLAKVMREQGLIDDAHSSGGAIRAWLADHRGPVADAVMRQNPRYVFFRLDPDDGGQPPGSAGVPLPAGRAIAVDLTRHAVGEIYWIDASAPALAGAFPVYRRLTAALDTGGAIKGDIRADLYIGRGDAAGREAGRVRHVLHLYRLVPLAEPAP